MNWRWQDTIGLQHPEEKNFALGITYAWWNAADEWNHLAGRWGVRHQWQRENQDPEKHQHEAQHETQQWRHAWGTRERARSCSSILSLSCCCHTHPLHTSFGSRCSSVCLISSHGHRHACMKWAFSLTSLTSSSPSLSSSHSSLSSSNSFYPSTSPRLSSKIPCALRQGDGVYWRILLQDIRGNTKIGPALEVTTSYLQGKSGVEIWIESVNKDHSHSWVRISHGLYKLVTDLSSKQEDDDNEQEKLRCSSKILRWKRMYLLLRADHRPKHNHDDVLLPAQSTKTVPVCERSWTQIEPETYSPIACTVSKQLSTLLRHGHLPREEDGALEIWRIKDHLQNHFVHSQHWSDEMWKSKMAGGGGNKKIFQYCTDPSGKRNSSSPSSSRSFRTQSCWFFFTGQCLDSGRFLQVHSSRRMCNQFTFHHQFRIDTGRTNFEQKTDGILYVSESYEQRTQRSE